MSLRSRLRAAVLSLTALLLTGCLAPPPRLAVETHYGVVRADSKAPALEVADLLDELVPHVRRLLPDTRTDDLEVWVQTQLAVYRGWPVDSKVPAFTVEGEGRIHLLDGDRIALAAALGHELVHAMLGPGWSTLPAVAEEGLADWMQEQLNPPVRSSLRADHLAKAGAAAGGLDFAVWSRDPHHRGRRLATIRFPEDIAGEQPLDPRRALDEGDEDKGGLFQPYQVAVSDPRLYGVGYLVVSRIVERRGLEGLYQLCRRAEEEGRKQVSADALMTAAHLSGGPATWRRLVIERVRQGELMALGRQLVPTLVQLVVEDVGPRSGATSGRDFLRRSRPVFGLVDGDLRLDLDSLPGFRRALLRAWPAPRRRHWVQNVTDHGKQVSWDEFLAPAAAPLPLAAPGPAGP